jgi:hypothetical protein
VVLLLLAVGLARATGDGDESCSPEYPINVNVLLDSSTARWIAQVSDYVSSIANVSIAIIFQFINSLLKEYYVEAIQFQCVIMFQMI